MWSRPFKRARVEKASPLPNGTAAFDDAAGKGESTPSPPDTDEPALTAQAHTVPSDTGGHPAGKLECPLWPPAIQYMYDLAIGSQTHLLCILTSLPSTGCAESTERVETMPAAQQSSDGEDGPPLPLQAGEDEDAGVIGMAGAISISPRETPEASPNISPQDSPTSPPGTPRADSGLSASSFQNPLPPFDMFERQQVFAIGCSCDHR